MSEQQRPGYYLDAEGNWQVDRRRSNDRRGAVRSGGDHERRTLFRRHADRELLKTDHKIMIEEALVDFAESHDGHL